MFKKTIEKIYLVLIIVLLYAPIATLMVLSFNDSRTSAKWGGFTLKWYSQLMDNSQIISAFWTTIVLAILSAVIATIIGTMAAIGMSNMKKRGRTLVLGMTNIPMLNADIVTGIALMLLFVRLSDFIEFGFVTVLISHITFNIPYVILNVLPKLKQINKHVYEAALDFGATPLYAFFKVVLPDLLPGVLTGFLLAFTMSLDDFVITHFTKGAAINTLSTKLYAEIRKGIKPEMYALSTLMFLAVLILLFIINKGSKKKNKGDR